jgi:hypothetical protein
MPRTLGVSCKADVILIALAEDGILVEIAPEHKRLQAPDLLEETEQLRALQDAVGRVLADTGADLVRLLLPEPTYKGSYMALATRAALETVVRLAGEKANVTVEVLRRNTARARVGMPQRGKFEPLIASVIPTGAGRYWAEGRRLAAIAAIADPKAE